MTGHTRTIEKDAVDGEQKSAGAEDIEAQRRAEQSQKIAAMHGDIMKTIHESISRNLNQVMTDELATGLYHVLSGRLMAVETAHLMEKNPDKKEGS